MIYNNYIKYDKSHDFLLLYNRSSQINKCINEVQTCWKDPLGPLLMNTGVPLVVVAVVVRAGHIKVGFFDITVGCRGAGP